MKSQNTQSRHKILIQGKKYSVKADSSATSLLPPTDAHQILAGFLGMPHDKSVQLRSSEKVAGKFSRVQLQILGRAETELCPDNALFLSKNPTLPGRGLLFLQILGQAPSLGSFEVPSAGGATWWLLLQLLGLPSDYLIDHPQSLFNLTAKWGWVLFCKSHTLPGNYLRLLQILGQALNRTAP